MEGVAGDEFFRIVERQFTPFIGQEFVDLEEVVKLYRMYALACGFYVRRYTTKKWRDGTVKSKLLVCNRQGFTYAKKVNKEIVVADTATPEDAEPCVGDKPRRKSKVTRIGCNARLRVSAVKGVLVVDRFHAGHNHELVEVKDRQFQKLATRLQKYHKELILFNSRLKIGASKTYRMCKEHVSGFENIGASLNQIKKFHRDVKCYINERDGQLFIDRFKNLADTRQDFYFDYEVDADNSLVRAVWADGEARRNYSVFGDAVSFDPTYSTNKYSMVFTPFTGVDNHRRSVTFCGALLFRENEESFTWLFRHFLDAMGGKEPVYLITDQDPGIIACVANVLKTARHRFCMWHIMNKVPSKYWSSATDFQEFQRKLNGIVWDEELEAHEFDGRWSEIMEEYAVGPEREWFEELPIEIHGVSVYTHEMFEEFQREVISSTTGLSARVFSEENGVEITNLKDGPRSKVFDIKFNLGTYEVSCTCRNFERCGMLCRHIISIFSSNGMKSIPECYVARRWCKDAVGKTYENEDVIDGRQIQLTKLWSEVYEIVGLLKARGEEEIGYLCNLLREFRLKLDPESGALTKEQEIEQLLGCKPVDEIRILPPKHAKNKGSGKRMLSTKTVAVAKAVKPKRMCNNCKQMAHHDKRNCPNPFAQFPPPQPESFCGNFGYVLGKSVFDICLLVLVFGSSCIRGIL
ncbi:hypothetical protein RND81_03G024000 [Saponaria officinalis]|uniref:SWIM-type domain-containing protein n=1 Tax=Saponaria officinalis TaxID=3572 RepID=A0AAW1M4T1_SAPOF